MSYSQSHLEKEKSIRRRVVFGWSFELVLPVAKALAVDTHKCLSLTVLAGKWRAKRRVIVSMRSMSGPLSRSVICVTRRACTKKPDKVESRIVLGSRHPTNPWLTANW